MLSNTKCKQILNKNGVFYTDEEIVILKEAFYKMAEIMWRSHRETNKIRNLKVDILK